MTEKKLTDEEIIKRLERCVKRGNRNYDTDIVLDLINRKMAEIENLEKQMDWLTGYNKNLMDANTALSDEILEAKAEAYKEFAKKLKEEIRLEDDCDYNCRECFYECNDYVIAIDNLLKKWLVRKNDIRRSY